MDIIPPPPPPPEFFELCGQLLRYCEKINPRRVGSDKSVCKRKQYRYLIPLNQTLTGGIIHDKV